MNNLKRLILSAILINTVSLSYAEEEASEDTCLEERAVKLTLQNGKNRHGHYKECEDTWISTRGDISISIPKRLVTNVKDVELREGSDKKIIGASRHFYAPSAYMLPAGDMTFSQKELFFSSLAYGVNDHLSILAGSVIPAFFEGLDATNLILAIKTGLPIYNNLHWATGFEVFIFSDARAILPFTSLTYGTKEHQVTYNLSYPISSEYNDSSLLLHNISLQLKLNNHFALIGESYLMPSLDTEANVIVVGGRILGDTVYVDVGFIFVQDSHVPFPWLDFSVDF